ncbi:hypothetical protein TNIN_226891 [Trichonephila inaurata madagascariensis]|uniref:Uncharacterized protein n=1 Tax=Trichonephila inaurata madagascariensis TaxID=2747483 RepID=A0A8X7CFJ3_9ARAC|nr:hypothetical protein TNIN_226891 [Trichonephila inaurata madagascariensis]
MKGIYGGKKISVKPCVNNGGYRNYEAETQAQKITSTWRICTAQRRRCLSRGEALSYHTGRGINRKIWSFNHHICMSPENQQIGSYK